MEVSTKSSEEWAPSSVENKLLSIWREILGSDQLRVNDDFFDAGANSPEAYLACSEVLAEFGVDLSIVEVFNHPNVKDLARRINEIARDAEGSGIVS